MKPRHFALTGFFTFLMFLTPISISFTYKSPTNVSVGSTETQLVRGSSKVAMLTPILSAAEARDRIEHGLPMTRVPFRYSIYFFMFAIILVNVFDTVRRNRRKNGEREEDSLPLHTSSV